MSATRNVKAYGDLKRIRSGLTDSIAKIGLHAVTLAVFALAGMMFVGASPAIGGTIVLSSGGSSTPAVQDQGMVGWYSNNDIIVQTPSIDALGFQTYLNYNDGDGSGDSFTTTTTYNNTLNP